MKKLIIVGCLILSGCASVQDRDFEAEEKAFIKAHGSAALADPMYAPPTAPDVFAGKTDGVTITIHKIKSTITEDKIELQNWNAVLTNTSKEDVCVATIWKLMDFELVTQYPELTYMHAGDSLQEYAVLKQQIWNMEGTRFALPPSGYVQELIVKPAKDTKIQSEKCEFENEKQITE